MRKDKGKRKEGVSVPFVLTSSLKQRKTTAGLRCSGELFPAVWGRILLGFCGAMRGEGAGF